jgi:hypothetical protein
MLEMMDVAYILQNATDQASLFWMNLGEVMILGWLAWTATDVNISNVHQRRVQRFALLLAKS